jgi:uncharacterized protein (TIGR02145 family)
MNRKNNIVICKIFTMLLFVVFVNGCKKEEVKDKPVNETGTLVDTVNHVVYKTVKIGNRWWMAENLKGTKYSNGVSIPKLKTADTLLWKNDTIGAYCSYADGVNTTGLLYNWYAVNNAKKIAPAGWHVPSDEEWKELERSLGMGNTDVEQTSWRGTDEGEKLKISSTTSPICWTQVGAIWSTNESGFTALAGNCRLFNGIWGTPDGLYSTGFWWTSQENKGENANVFRYYGPKTYGFSIRCVKDY